MKNQTLILALFLVAATMLSGYIKKTSDSDKGIQLTFVDHLQAGFIEQDVFVEKRQGKTMLPLWKWVGLQGLVRELISLPSAPHH